MYLARALARYLAHTVCFGVLASCAAKVPVGAEFNAASKAHAVVVDVPFVTNRALRPTGSEGDYFGGGRGQLSAGRCRVAFEENDTRGQVLRVDAESMNGVLQANGDEPFVIYIHGYGESFAKNCRRAALLKHRLQMNGRFLLFSWPAGNYLTYGGDVVDMRASVDQLNELLSLAADSLGGERLVILAHSLGTRGIVEALARRPEASPTFGKVVLIASDLRRKVFLEKAQMLREKATDVTVYMSDKDRVLMLSAAINTSGRLGLAKEFDIDAERMHFVDVTTAQSSDITGHLYHLFSPAVTEDLRHLFGTEQPGLTRKYQRVSTQAPGFWKLEPREHQR